MNLKKNSRMAAWLLGLTALLGSLAACGDNTSTSAGSTPGGFSTSTPNTTPSAANSGSGPTATAGVARGGDVTANLNVTLAPATPSRPSLSGSPAVGPVFQATPRTLVGTTAASGTPVVISLPSFAGVKELPLDPSVSEAAARSLSGLNGRPLFVKFYVSDQEQAQLASQLHKGLLESSYKFTYPGQPNLTEPQKTQSDRVYAGIYTNPSGYDLIMGVLKVSSDISQIKSDINLPGLDEATLSRLSQQWGSAKSIAIVLIGPDLIRAATSGGSSSSGNDSTATTRPRPSTDAIPPPTPTR